MHKSKLSLPWLIELAKVRLEDDGYEVVQGIISPVADNYVATLAATSATKKKLAPAEHRVLMCQKAVSDSGWVVVNDVDSRRREWTSTYKLLLEMRTFVKETIGMLFKVVFRVIIS